MGTFESRIDNKLDKLQDDITEIKVQLSKMPSEFVPRAEIRRLNQWLVGTMLAVIGLGIQVWVAL